MNIFEKDINNKGLVRTLAELASKSYVEPEIKGMDKRLYTLSAFIDGYVGKEWVSTESIKNGFVQMHRYQVEDDEVLVALGVLYSQGFIELMYEPARFGRYITGCRQKEKEVG